VTIAGALATPRSSTQRTEVLGSCEDVTRNLCASAVVFCAALGAAWACSSFEADSIDTGADAAPDASDAATEAAPSDAGDASALFCDSIDASLCWSFDEPNYLTGPRFVLQANSASVRTTDSTPKSPPFALDLSLSTKDGGFEFGGILHEQLTTAAKVKCTFDVRIVTSSTSDVLIAELAGNASLTTTRIRISPSGAFDLLVTQRGTTTTTPLGTYEINKWLNVTMEVDSADLAARASVEGTPGTQMLDVDAGVASLNRVALGVAPAGMPSPWRMNFDNVFCTGF
jgi:hypothetical protein